MSCSGVWSYFRNSVSLPNKIYRVSMPGSARAIGERMARLFATPRWCPVLAQAVQSGLNPWHNVVWRPREHQSGCKAIGRGGQRICRKSHPKNNDNNMITIETSRNHIAGKKYKG